MRRQKSAGRGKARGKSKYVLPKSQRTLMDYIEKKEAPVISSASQPTSLTSLTPEGISEEINRLQKIKTDILDLIERNRLNEVVNTFAMQDRLCCSVKDMKYLYRVTQEEIVKKFGAPLSPSLFPSDIFTEDTDQSGTF